jgi:hypothetical protein
MRFLVNLLPTERWAYAHTGFCETSNPAGAEACHYVMPRMMLRVSSARWPARRSA